MSSILVCEPHEFPTFPANNLFNSHKRGRYAPWYDTWSIIGMVIGWPMIVVAATMLTWRRYTTTILIWTTGGRLNKKDHLTGYGDSHVKDKTSYRPSYL